MIEPARRRLVFDELFRLQLALVLRRRAFEVNARALRHDVSPREITGAVADTLVARFLARLPYELTKAQRRALAVIVADMAGPVPDAPPPPGRRGVGQDRGRAGRAAGGGAERAPGCLHGADRGAGRAALLCRARPAGRPGGPGGMAGGEVRVELLTSRVKGKARTAVLGGTGLGRGGRGGGDPRAADRGGRRSPRSAPS